ncbi:MAG: O-antigen ligase family protein [Actinomycetota bacterium]
MPSSRARLALLALGVAVCTNGPVFYLQFRVFDHPWDWTGPVVREAFIALSVASAASVALSVAQPGWWVARRRAERVVIGIVSGFTLWIVATSLWSVAPDITRSRSIIYVGLACFAWLLAQLRFEDLRRVLVLAIGALLVASAAAVVLSDSIGWDDNDDWRGIFTNRNSLAPIAALGVILSIGLVIERRGRARLGPAALGLLGAALMFGSGSRTAWLAMLCAIGLGSVIVLTRLGRDRFGSSATLLGGAAAVIGAIGAAVVVGSLWNESTFEQRRTIWGYIVDQIGERVWHGHGWFTIWTQQDFTSQHYLLTRGSAHSSVHEVWLGAGLIGLVGFLAIVAFALTNAGLDAWRRPGVATWTWLSIVAFLVIENLTESFVLWFSYNWVLVMVAAFSVGSARPARRDHRTPAPAEAVSV